MCFAFEVCVIFLSSFLFYGEDVQIDCQFELCALFNTIDLSHTLPSNVITHTALPNACSLYPHVYCEPLRYFSWVLDEDANSLQKISYICTK